ncbi:MAG TPA: SRPBCC family protein [Bacteroidia bacterium]|nr:SRPBCC family protein [Bacteroidia bacterium]
MKIIKKILIFIVVVIAVALIAALFVKKDYAVEREIVINKPNAEVFAYVKMIKNQDYYSVWNMKDPASTRASTGTDGTVGYVYSWDSKMDDVGQGEQEITKIAEGQRVDMELRFKRPFESTGYAYMTTDAVGDNQTKVKWGFTGAMPYPMNLMLVFMNMDEMLGKDLADGLSNLKGVLEKQ